MPILLIGILLLFTLIVLNIPETICSETLSIGKKSLTDDAGFLLLGRFPDDFAALILIYPGIDFDVIRAPEVLFDTTLSILLLTVKL